MLDIYCNNVHSIQHAYMDMYIQYVGSRVLSIHVHVHQHGIAAIEGNPGISSILL